MTAVLPIKIFVGRLCQECHQKKAKYVRIKGLVWLCETCLQKEVEKEI